MIRNVTCNMIRSMIQNVFCIMIRNVLCIMIQNVFCLHDPKRVIRNEFKPARSSTSCRLSAQSALFISYTVLSERSVTI